MKSKKEKSAVKMCNNYKKDMSIKYYEVSVDVLESLFKTNPFSPAYITGRHLLDFLNYVPEIIDASNEGITMCYYFKGGDVLEIEVSFAKHLYLSTLWTIESGEKIAMYRHMVSLPDDTTDNELSITIESLIDDHVNIILKSLVSYE